MEGNKLKTEISKKPTGVFYLDGNRVFFYEQTLSTPLSTAIPQDALSDLELISKKKLETVIQTFISSNKLIPKNIILLLSTQVTFDKDFTQSSIEITKNIDEFLELVPFEDTISKKAVFSGRTKIVAANKELCETIKSAFQNSGFIVSGVFPLSFLLETMPQLQSNLDLGEVLAKAPDMREFNLLPTYEAPVNAPLKEKPSKTRLYALGGVFGLLLLVLGFFVYKNVLAPKPVPKILPLPTLAPAAPTENAPVIEISPVPTGVTQTIPGNNSTASANKSSTVGGQ